MRHEIWSLIKSVSMESNYLRCEVSSIGRIRNINGPMKPTKVANGYLGVEVWINTSKKLKRSLLLHRIVAETFLPNPEGKRCVNHKNGIKTDNSVENLEWATHSENTLHSYRELGRTAITSQKTRDLCKKRFSGEGNPKAKLNWGDVELIRQSRLEGIPAKELALKFNISVSQIQRIHKGSLWNKQSISTQ